MGMDSLDRESSESPVSRGVESVESSQSHRPSSHRDLFPTPTTPRIYQHQTPKETSKDGTYMDSTTRRSTMVIDFLFRAQDGRDGGGGIGLSRQNQQPNSTQIFFWPCLRNGPHISHPPRLASQIVRNAPIDDRAATHNTFRG